ncbi:hypothetical protein OOK27_12270 [Streptomyces canus]|uniref:hypothetical protein n=1 Tax=Streptomyces canus TaxID=58343 RepID=UPI00225B69E6|nr:hypothetical protein [Streptomyces canus]MCX5254936.1 hypothetical protein [Streptomyces canus]
MDIAALILILWIALYLFDANTANSTVSWIHEAANWLSGWSHNLTTRGHAQRIEAGRPPVDALDAHAPEPLRGADGP